MSDLIAKANSVTDIITRVASFGVKALPVAQLIASFVPGGGVIVAAIQTALPWIQKVEALAPSVRAAVAAGEPITAAIVQSGPDLIGALKNIYAIAVNHDPERPETAAMPEHILDREVVEIAYPVIFGRRMTQDEENVWMDRFGIGSQS